MAENTAENCNFFDDLAETFWATLPEKTADDLAKCKRDGLTWIKDAVTGFVDDEIKTMERHLANARRLRQRCQETEPPAADGPQPA